MIGNPYAAARDAWILEHPGPTELDFPCRQCRAQPGEPCHLRDGRIRPRSHLARQDRYARAFTRWQRAASDAADAVINQENEKDD